MTPPEIPNMDPEAKKTVLRQIPYGLYAVTTHRGDEVNGMLANFLSQCSFDPPLVMLSVENDSKTLAFIREGRNFGVNLLNAGQRELAGGLSKSTKRNPGLDKLASVDFHASELGNPILDQAVGFFECQVLSETPAGDSVVFIAELTDAQILNQGEVLTMKEAGFKHAG